MEHFDLEAPADVFVGAGLRNGRHPMVYRRFETGAEAIRHVIEAVEPTSLPGAVIENDEVRLGAAEIRAIYDSTDFPLARRASRPRITGELPELNNQHVSHADGIGCAKRMAMIEVHSRARR